MASATAAPSKRRPNILLLITDQERGHMHWPKDWTEKNLPAQYSRLGGVTFENAFTASTECCPSRACMLTSSYPQEHGVTTTPGSLDPSKPNLLRLMSEQAGYETAYKGKWHLLPRIAKSEDVDALQEYGVTGVWDPPDAGTTLGIDVTLGGGVPDNDGRYMRGNERNEEEESIFDFLEKKAQENNDKPFFLVASLVNPHDIHVVMAADDDDFDCIGYTRADFESLPISLPSNMKDDLEGKPSIHEYVASHSFFGRLPERQALDYVRFYAYLHTLVDANIGEILDKLESTGLMKDTVIIRTSDHGEQAMSHGMRQKRLQCYDETIRVPLVISMPGEQQKITSNAMVSSIDLLPTIAELAGIRDLGDSHFRGKSLVPVLDGRANESDHDSILFTFDEPLVPSSYAGLLRCIRTRSYKYAVYFNKKGTLFEYELYDLSKDLGEMINLAGPDTEPEALWIKMHDELTQLMIRMEAVPSRFEWAAAKPQKWHYTRNDAAESLKKEKPKEKRQMTSMERIALAEAIKAEGTHLFKAKKYERAAVKYEEAAYYAVGDADKITEDEHNLYVTCLCNAAMCYVKLEQWSNAIDASTKVLKVDANNLKALYRRGLARLHSGQLEESKQDLMAAYNIDKTNKDVRRALTALKEAIAEEKKKEKQAFCGIFSKKSKSVVPPPNA